MSYSNTLSRVTIGKKRPNADDIKIIGGHGYDLRQPIPIKYQIVRERFLNARNNFWTPNDIPMSEDKVQWNSDHLSDAERHLFKTNISYLTASDNLVPDNLVNAIMSHITANEMLQYLRHQIFEEANHLESYLFILESFGLDEAGQGEIFTLYQETPALLDKLNWNLDFTRNLAMCKTPQGDHATNRCLLEDLISYYVFEFMFFPLGFSQVFALARNGKLKNTAEQYAYIWRDENIHADNCLWLIRQIIKENPVLWDKAMQDRARAIVDEAVHLETNYAHASMPDDGIIGYSVNTYIEYAKFIGDLICKNLGTNPNFGVDIHPATWMSEFELNKEKNFFESRVTEYRTGANLNWDSEDST